ncbi:MAG TPA: hypothetical protein VEB64_12675 [Azospirillaceae bacterium]|nr:hypothetical protein [Azospirillaceae bacterium]
MLLLCGGHGDPNMTALAQRMAERRVPGMAVLIHPRKSVPITWDLTADRLTVNGAPVRPSGMFLRYDVFAPQNDRQPGTFRRTQSWYYTFMSWALAHEEAAFLNRAYATRQPAKPYVVALAKRLGLLVPDTLLTNDPAEPADADPAEWISKPVTGGDVTRPLAEAREHADEGDRAAPAPSIVQRRINGPDLRIYRIAGRSFAFELASDALDYRTTQKPDVREVTAPEHLIRPLDAVMERLGLDYGAADFKTDPKTGEHYFLEVNSAPMFAAFDRIAEGRLCDALIDALQPPS